MMHSLKCLVQTEGIELARGCRMTKNDYNCYYKYNINILQQSNFIKMEEKHSMQMKQKSYFFTFFLPYIIIVFIEEQSS